MFARIEDMSAWNYVSLNELETYDISVDTRHVERNVKKKGSSFLPTVKYFVNHFVRKFI